MYKVEYLPLALHDLQDIMKYISHDLSNPDAAVKLAADIIDTMKNVALFPYVSLVYMPVRQLKHDYRKIAVKNYSIFYWVEEQVKTVIVARVIYSARDYEKML